VGTKYNIQLLKNDYLLENKNDDEWIMDPNFTNIFNYDQNLAAAYLTYAWEPGKFGVKLGARLEHTQLETMLENTNEENNQKYTNLFPSSHISYKVNKKLSLQAGYSKRISRPHWRSLNPFSSLRDNYNLRMGNPALKPEYTDAFELTAIQIWEKMSLNGSVFYRYSSDVITNVIEVQDSLTVTHPENIGESYNLGFELNGKIEPAKWLAFLVDSYFTSYKRTGEFEAQNFDFNSTFWSGRLTTKLQLPKDIDAEILVRHRSKYKDLQSTSKAQTYADFGIKKKFMKGRAVVNLSVRDIFATRKSISVSDTPNFYRYSEHMRDGRRIILGFSYGFGKGEAMEFSGHKMF
jgi:outer membrane receptor protein involved in Fe transport